MYPASFTAQQPQNDLVDDEILIHAPPSFTAQQQQNSNSCQSRRTVY